MLPRITPFKMKSDAVSKAREMVAGLEGEIMGMPGMIHFTCCMDDTGQGYIVALVESEERSNANMPKVKEIWAKFFEMLETPPEPRGFPVVAHWGG